MEPEILYDWIADKTHGIRGSQQGDGGLWCKGFPQHFDPKTRVATVNKVKYYLLKEYCCTVGKCTTKSEQYLSGLQ